MTSDQHPIWEWLTGLSAQRGDAIEQIVVVQGQDRLAELRAGGLVDGRSRLYLQAAPGNRPAGDRAETFEGDFTAGDEDIRFGNGYSLHSRQYGMAEFHCLDTPTVLRISDAHDLSAFLRDADQAWLTGVFAHHVTHPNAVIADLAGLGGGADGAGPMHRIFVFDDAAVSTSPTGTILGTAGESVQTLHRRWSAANLGTRIPDAGCLGRAVADQDRTDALAERPWIGRYLAAIRCISLVRREYRVPSRVSGFGGRMTPGLPAPSAADPPDAPLLLEVGNEYQAHDPVDGRLVVLSAPAVGVLESLLALPDQNEATHWCTEHLRMTEAGTASLLATTARQLASAGVAGDWCRKMPVGVGIRT